eukprot:UN05162
MITDCSKPEIQLWTDELIKCMRKLMKWDEVFEQVLADVDDRTENFWIHRSLDDRRQKLVYLQDYIDSSMRQKKYDSLFTFLDDSLTDTKKRSILEDSHTSALTFMYLNRGDYSRCHR